MDEKSIMEEAKQEACMDLMQDTACKIKKLIAPFKSFPNDKKDPVVAVTWDLSIELIAVDALVVCAITLFVIATGMTSLSIVMLLVGMTAAVLIPFFLDRSCKKGRVRQWLLNKMRTRFEGNETEIHRLEVQLDAMWNEYLEQGGDKELNKDGITCHLYDWYKEARLPMPDVFKDFFADEVKRRSMAEDAKRLKTNSYNEELVQLRRLADEAVDEHGGTEVLRDNGLLAYDGDDQRLRLLVERVNKIAGRMEAGETGSGVAFVAGLRAPFESLLRLSVMEREEEREDGSGSEIAGLFHKSIGLFDARLDREESRLDGLAFERASMEYEVLGSLLA